MTDFWQGQMMTADAVFELTGQHIDPNILTVHPTGNMVHVLLEEPPKEYGSIIIPEAERGREQMGVGYIIATGPKAGSLVYSEGAPAIIGVIGGEGAETSACLLGLHVIFGSHVGMPLRVSMLDREFKASVLVMPSKDIRGVDTNPVPLTIRVEERSRE